jgi:hypothetical protein
MKSRLECDYGKKRDGINLFALIGFIALVGYLANQFLRAENIPSSPSPSK